MDKTKMKVYLDTSVISYLEQDDAPEKMEITRKVWELFKKGNYELYMSNLVTYELNKCKDVQKRKKFAQRLNEVEFFLVDIVENVENLAQEFVSKGILKEKSLDDCKHIATAMMYECDYIISWNFKHIVNVRTVNGVREIAMENGRKNISIYSPEFFEEDA